MTESVEEEVQIIVDFEGYSVEEAKLSYAERKNLPSTAFCGPHRSYPAHDAKHVRNALARLSQFGKRLSPAVRAKILSCLRRRAKKFGIEINETEELPEDTPAELDAKIKWLYEQYGINK